MMFISTPLLLKCIASQDGDIVTVLDLSGGYRNSGHFSGLKGFVQGNEIIIFWIGDRLPTAAKWEYAFGA